MNKLEAKVSSKQIADFLGKRHHNICQKIENTINENSFLVENQHITESTYEMLMPVGGGVRKYKMYELDRVGFDTVLLSLLAKKALRLKQIFACVLKQL